MRHFTLAVLALAAVALSAISAHAEPFKVGFVYVGPIGDHGWTYRHNEGRTVAGIIAGRMTKSNVIGYIGSFPIPEVVRGINAFTIASRRVNPKATVKVVWVSTWYDPRKEAEAAKVLMDQGADVILQHTDSTAPIQAAQDAGKWAAGQASDMTQFAPKSHLTAIIAGTQHPFQGPFSKQDGIPAAKDGETLDDGTLLGMNWYVEGVEGQLPK